VLLLSILVRQFPCSVDSALLCVLCGLARNSLVLVAGLDLNTGHALLCVLRALARDSLVLVTGLHLNTGHALLRVLCGLARDGLVLAARTEGFGCSFEHSQSVMRGRFIVGEMR
jgi:hypothetical protein